MTDSTVTPIRKLPLSLRLTALAPALRSRNFRLFWLAQLVSTIGTSLQVVAEGWLIYNVTESTFWLGAVGFIGLLPVVPISLLGGVLIDRVPRRKLIMATQAGLMIQAAIFAGLALSGQLALGHIIALYFVFGALLAIDHPARRAFLVDIVERKDLANAVALNATLFNVSSLIGYALAGVLIALIGAGGTMALNSASYLLPLFALGAIKVADIGLDTQKQKLGIALSEGALTLLKQPVILGAISLMAVVGGLAWPIFGLMPAFAEAVLGAGSVGLGFLLAMGALGSVVGTVVVARLGSFKRGRWLALSSLLLPLMVLGFGYSSKMAVAALFVFLAGIVLLVVQSLTITLVQINIADRVRGRVMSLYSMLHAGADTLGNMVIGAIAVYAGLSAALVLGGFVALLYALILWLILPTLRRLE